MSTKDEAERLAEEFVANFNEVDIEDVHEFGSDIQLYQAGFRAGEKSENVMRLINEVKGLIHSCGSDYCTYPDCGCFPEIKRILESLNASPEEKK